MAVAFLLTDVEGSTGMWEEQPAEMSLALARLDEIVAESVASAGGTFKPARGEGDSHFAVFGDCEAAVACAVALQNAIEAVDWPTDRPLRTRAGIHWGDVEERALDYYGTTVNRAARLRAIAHGGQIVVSGEVQHRVQSLPVGAELVDRGHHRLKDLQEPMRVFEVRRGDTPLEFPPLTSLDGRRHNLPEQATTFVGRAEELSALVKFVESDDRLVTLLGPGGVGKTRLSIQAAAESVDRFPDGVWLVELAGVFEAERVAPKVLSVLGAGLDGDPISTLVSYLEVRRLMLVLDNCEQVVAGVAALADQLVKSCPGVTIVASSRERLGVSGEQILRLEGLPCPAEDDDELVAQFAAVRLFTDRADGHGVALGPSAIASVARICRRLEGVPLALELAASRVGVLTPEEIDKRLGEKFSGLGVGPRTADPRQRTLRGAIDWSFDLLDEVERALFRRLSIFVGGFTLEAAEEICGFDPLSSEAVLDLLSALVDKSLVIASSSGGSTRYRMLETIRAYASDRAEEAGEAVLVSSRHLQRFREWAAGETSQGEPDRKVTVKEFKPEAENVRSALDFAAKADPAAGIQLFWSTLESWEVGTRVAEGVRRLEAMLEAHDEEDVTYLYGLSMLGLLSVRLGEVEQARQTLETAVELARDRKHHERLSACLVLLAQIDAQSGEGEPERLLEEALSIARESGGLSSLADVLSGLGRLHAEKDATAAIAELQEAIHIRRELGDHGHLPALLENLAVVQLRSGNLPEARRLAEEGKELAEALGVEDIEASVGFMLGRLLIESGDLDEAEALFLEVQENMERIGMTGEAAYASALMGELSRIRGDWAVAEGHFTRAIAGFERTGQTVATAFVRGNLGHIALAQADAERAMALATPVLRFAVESGISSLMVEMIELHAEIDAAEGRAERALRAFGAARALRQEAGFARDAADEPDFQTGLTQATAVMGELAEELLDQGAVQGHQALTEEYLAVSPSDPGSPHLD